MGLPNDPLIRPSFREACRLWLKIGCLSFGGPAAQISLMHEELVVSFSLLRWGRWPGVALVVLAAGMGILRPILGL